MDARVKDVMVECTKGSEENRLKFPQVVMKLMEAGVEQYYADYRRSEKVYYMPNGETEAVASARVDVVIPPDFSAKGVEAAVRAVQAGKVSYKEFCEQTAKAGCVGYFVCLAGRQAIYFGRTGASYVEPFPPAAN
jgi:uncharacterized protein YbcV (DUF1398 family)